MELQAGEFRELTDIGIHCDMSSVNLSLGLPLGLFEGLDSVGQPLHVLQPDHIVEGKGVFAGLQSITRLRMDNNSVDSIAGGSVQCYSNLGVFVDLLETGLTIARQQCLPRCCCLGNICGWKTMP